MYLPLQSTGQGPCTPVGRRAGGYSLSGSAALLHTQPRSPSATQAYSARGSGRDHGCAATFRPVSSGSSSQGASPPPSPVQRHERCVPSCIGAIGQQSQSTAADICLHLFTSCRQRDYPSPPPPDSSAFSDSLGTDWASLPITRPFLLLRVKFTHNCRDFPAPCSQTTSEVGLLSAVLQVTCRAQYNAETCNQAMIRTSLSSPDTKLSS